MFFQYTHDVLPNKVRQTIIGSELRFGRVMPVTAFITSASDPLGSGETNSGDRRDEDQNLGVLHCASNIHDLNSPFALRVLVSDLHRQNERLELSKLV